MLVSTGTPLTNTDYDMIVLRQVCASSERPRASILSALGLRGRDREDERSVILITRKARGYGLERLEYPMIRRVTARKDPALSARIVHSEQLYYDGPQPEGDRPSFVRAGSSLTQFAERVAVVQDNANFLALIDPVSRRAQSLELPADSAGDRVFDEDHDNKRLKFDLEACMTVPLSEGEMLVAFGSGSAPHRTQIVTVALLPDEEPRVSVHDASAFYAVLAEAHDFSGSGLNVEGAVWLGDDTFRLFQRGNMDAHDGLEPVNATGDISWTALRSHLDNPSGVRPPALAEIVQYDLGEMDGIRLCFSDAEPHSGSILYSASAEATPADGSDGRVSGSVLGIISPDGGARWASLDLPDGGTFSGKAEGLSIDAGNPHRAYFVTDPDESDEPSEMCEVELSGPWYEAIR